MRTAVERLLALVPPAAQGKIIRDLAYGCWCGGDRVGGGNLPPTHLLLVCTWLRKHGLHVELLDANEARNTVKEVCAQAQAFDAVVCLTSSLTFGADIRVLAALKAAKADLITILYGSHPTFFPEKCLASPAVDFALLSHPEQTLLHLLTALGSGTPLDAIPALAYREQEQVRVNRTPTEGKFTSLPPIEYDFLDPRLRYFNPLVEHYPYVTAMTSRGCASGCVFCTAPTFAGGRVEAWSAEQVVEQIQHIVQQGYQEIYFRDETFSAFRERNRQICEGILRLGIKVDWICNVKPGTATLEELRLMKRAGCKLVKVGVESGSDRVLARSGKGVSRDEIRSLLQDIHRAGLACHAHVMLGMPGETRETIAETINFVLEVQPTTLDVGICTALPGSPLWESISHRLPQWLEDTATESAQLHSAAVFNQYYGSVPGPELERSVRRLYRRFYLRPAYLWQQARWGLGAQNWSGTARAGLRVLRFMF